MRKRILCFGDSNTYGYIPLGGRYDEDVRWPTVMAGLLGDGYTVIEEGLNGRTCVFDDPVSGGYKSVILPFYGQGENENIIFVGYNLTYYYSITKDNNIGALLAGITQSSTEDLPDRRTVPISISYSKDCITVEAPEDNVNTTLAVHDMFKGSFTERNRLVYVNGGRTEIHMQYPYPVQSILMSVLGIAIVAVTSIFIKPRGKKEA